MEEAERPRQKDVRPNAWRYPEPEYHTVCNDCTTCCYNVICCPVLCYFTCVFCAEACITCNCKTCGCYLTRFYYPLHRDTETGPIIKDKKLKGNCYNLCNPDNNHDLP